MPAKLPTNHLNCFIAPSLDMQVRYVTDMRGISRSGAVRDLLRHALGITSTDYDAGWREGYAAAAGVLTERIRNAVARVPKFAP